MNTLAEQKLPPFTDLGRDLMADTNGHLHSQLLEEIKSKISAQEKIIASGLTAEEKFHAEKKLAAFNAAHRIVDLFWNSIHYKNHQLS